MKQLIITISLILIGSVPLIFLICVYPQKISKIAGNDYYISDELIYGIDFQQLKNEDYLFEGWVLLQGVEQGNAVLDNKSIWLKDIASNQFYKLDSVQSLKRDTTISDLIDDGIDYQSSFFKTAVSLEKLAIENKYLEVYICYQTHGINYLVKTGTTIEKGTLN